MLTRDRLFVKGKARLSGGFTAGREHGSIHRAGKGPDMLEAWPFITCVHDVSPKHEPQLRAIFDALRPLVGNRVSAAVIPYPDGRDWPPWSTGFSAFIKDRTGEILLHGLTHRRVGSRSLFSWVIRHCDEFATLAPGEAESRLHAGREKLAALFGIRPRGFVAPAWRPGALTPAMLESAGIEYRVGFRNILRSGLRIPLATCSWDWGRLGVTGWPGEFLGDLLRLRRGAIPCIVIHPADVGRGFLRRAVRRIESLATQGGRPVLVSECIEEPSRR